MDQMHTYTSGVQPSFLLPETVLNVLRRYEHYFNHWRVITHRPYEIQINTLEKQSYYRKYLNEVR